MDYRWFRITVASLVACCLSIASSLKVTVTPAQVSEGDPVRLHLAQQGKPTVYVGGHEVGVTQINKSTDWLFYFPPAVSLGPQPVRVAIGDVKAEENRVDAWIESLGTAKRLTSGFVANGTGNRLLIGSKPDAPISKDLLNKSLNSGLIQIRNSSYYKILPNFYKEYFNNIPKSIQDIKIINPNFKLPSPRIPLDNFPVNIPRSPFPVVEKDWSEVIEKLRQYPSNKQTINSVVDSAIKYQMELINRAPSKPATALTAQTAISIQDAKKLPNSNPTISMTPLANNNLTGLGIFAPPVEMTQKDNSVCGRTYSEVSIGSLPVALASEALRLNGIFSVDPTGYGVPSAIEEQTKSTPNYEDWQSMHEKSMQDTGIFKYNTQSKVSRINNDSSGRGVDIFIIDTFDGQTKDVFQHTTNYDGKNIISQGHGSIIGELLFGGPHTPGIAPGATPFYYGACGKRGCDTATIFTGICQAAQNARNGHSVIVNFSLNMPYRSTTFYKALKELSDAGGILVAAHGNLDRCKGGSSNGSTFRDFCNAYPADWVGAERMRGLRPPLNDGTAPGKLANLYSAGGWNSSKNSIAGYGREQSTPHFIPSFPSKYVPGEFYFKTDNSNPSQLYPYKGTSFATPVLVGLLANWISPGGSGDPTSLSIPMIGKLPQMNDYDPANGSGMRLKFEWLSNIVARKPSQITK